MPLLCWTTQMRGERTTIEMLSIRFNEGVTRAKLTSHPARSEYPMVCARAGSLAVASILRALLALNTTSHAAIAKRQGRG